MRKRHKVRIFGPAGGGGTQDPETGVMSGTPTRPTRYDGFANVQDGGVAQPLTQQGAPAIDADSTWFLEDTEAALTVQPDDVAEVWYPPDYERRREGNVVRTREASSAWASTAIDVKYR